MEISVLGSLVVMCFVWLLMGGPIGWNGFTLFGVRDSRERLYREERTGAFYGLLIEGYVGSLPRHEDYIHSGEPHRDPVIKRSMRFRWSLIPFGWESRLYPFTVTPTGGHVDLQELERRLAAYPPRAGQAIIVTYGGRERRDVERVEDRTQRARGAVKMARR